jgi:hypothetical protein
MEEAKSKKKLPPPGCNGRPKGVPNKSTGRVKDFMSLFLTQNVTRLNELLDKIEKGCPEDGLRPDPKGAAQFLMQVAEFVVPKLQRTEVVGNEGGPVQVATIDASKLSDDAIQQILAARKQQ